MSTELTLDCRINITEYDSLVLIEYIGTGWPKDHIDYIIVRSDDYKKLIRPRKKNPKPEQLLPEKIPIEQRVYRYAERYLRHYFEGSWDPGYDFDWTLSPQRYLQRGDYKNFYLGMAGNDGYLRHLDGTILSRKVNCEFWELSYHTTDLAATLKAHEKWSNVEIEDNTCVPNWSIVGRHRLRAKYIPSEGELEKLANRPNQKYPLTDVGGPHGVIHDRPEVKRHARIEKMRDRGYDDFDDDGLFDDDELW